jgi:type II secretory pathway component GspD/PulD (secretin)
MSRWLSSLACAGCLLALAACRQAEPEIPPLDANAAYEVLPAEQRALMDQARKFLDKQEPDPDRALDCLSQIQGRPAYPVEYEKLLTDVEIGKFKQDLAWAKERSRRLGIVEAEERLLIPPTYGKTVTVDGEDMSFHVPPGPMEELINRKVSMDLRDAGVQEVVIALSDLAKLNIIADTALTSDQRLTIKVDQVPLRELLSYISRNLGIAFHLGEDMIWVTAMAEEADTGPQLETRIFKLRTGLIPFIDGGSGNEFVAGGGAGGGSGGGGRGGEGGGGGGAGELDDALATFLEAGPPEATYRIYRNRNILMVRNTRENLRMVERLLELLDRDIRQVVIEARFINISESDLDELGYNLAQVQPHRSTTEPNKVMTIDNNLLRNFPADGNLALTGVIGSVEYEMVIHALDELSSVRSVSAPRVTVLNNQNAIIRRGDTIRYYEEYELETIPNEGGVAVSQPVPVGTVQELETGITFTVRPAISFDGRKVMLHLRPEIVQFLGWDEFITAQLPRSSESSVDTVVVIESGQTVILGGMVTDTEQDSRNQIPLLSQIPLVGHFFGNRSKSRMPNHLLIFVTAKILETSGEYVEFIP